MKHPLTLFATLCILAAPAAAQTIKSLGYNTTNGNIVAATNAVWTNAFNFSTNTIAAQVRTNLGLGLTALTNTNATTMLAALGLGGNPTSSGDSPVVGNHYVYAAWGLWDTAEDGGFGWRVEDSDIFIGQYMATTNAPTNTTNVVRWLKVLQGTNNYRIPLYK
jgi:hypothetical protein